MVVKGSGSGQQRVHMPIPDGEFFLGQFHYTIVKFIASGLALSHGRPPGVLQTYLLASKMAGFGYTIYWVLAKVSVCHGGQDAFELP
jgi:hypothetical protein